MRVPFHVRAALLNAIEQRITHPKTLAQFRRMRGRLLEVAPDDPMLTGVLYAMRDCVIDWWTPVGGMFNFPPRHYRQTRARLMRAFDDLPNETLKENRS